MKFKLLDPKLEGALSLLGGKAKNLRLLKSWGFPVPDAMVLTEEGDIPSEEEILELGGYPVAVRSSGALEDLHGASFAGLYETILDVKNRDELKLAIEKCFESKKSERVLDYLKQKKFESSDKLQMSVIIQKMVKSKNSGVLFTLNPLNGREEEFYLEFCKGLGEKLVSGLVTPTRVTFNWFQEQVIAYEESEEGRIPEEELKVLFTLAEKIQAQYGHPQDIEWSIDSSGKVFILQSRPITSFVPREDTPELTNADLKDGGISARVCTPFMFSVYREAMEITMGGYLKDIRLLKSDEGVQWLHYHYGRAFWNAEEVKKALTMLPGFSEEAFDRDLGIKKDYGVEGPIKTPLTVQGLINALPVLVGLYKEFLASENMVRVFRESFEARDRELKRKNGLFEDWFKKVILFQRETEQNYFRIIYNNSNYQTEFKNFLRELPSYEVFDEVYLMSELDGVSHLNVQEDLKKLKAYEGTSKYLEEREKFLEKHYHHGNSELDLTVPRWGESPEWIDELVKNFSEVPSSVDGHFKKVYTRISQSLNPISRYRFKRFVSRSRSFLRIREEMRAYSTRAYYLLRIGVLEFARRQNIPLNDIFMFDISEILKKLENPSYVLPSVEKRKAYYEGYRAFTPPNEFGGKILHGQNSSDLKGLGCSHGEKVGRARVVLTIEEALLLTKEDILITKFTDPGWTPVLARVGGVVTEVGGLLSHAAVIGREYGIPAILNLTNATKIIPPNSLIKINGKTGEIEILEESSES